MKNCEVLSCSQKTGESFESYVLEVAKKTNDESWCALHCADGHELGLSPEEMGAARLCGLTPTEFYKGKQSLKAKEALS